MRISDWSSDVCSSDLPAALPAGQPLDGRATVARRGRRLRARRARPAVGHRPAVPAALQADAAQRAGGGGDSLPAVRSEEHTSELQSLMRISYAVFCLKTKNYTEDTFTLHNNIPLRRDSTTTDTHNQPH